MRILTLETAEGQKQTPTSIVRQDLRDFLVCSLNECDHIDGKEFLSYMGMLKKMGVLFTDIMFFPGKAFIYSILDREKIGRYIPCDGNINWDIVGETVEGEPHRKILCTFIPLDDYEDISNEMIEKDLSSSTRIKPVDLLDLYEQLAERSISLGGLCVPYMEVPDRFFENI